uniref:Uncharacterized protein n=1 Tax=Panagrellus redivivus TaxID=6233 RepID=A0A7E4W649_PANRE
MQSLRLGRIAKFVGIFLLCCLVNVLFYGLPQRANIVTIKAFSDSLSQSNAQNVNCISTDSEQEHKAAAVNMDIVPDQEEKPLANLTKEEKEIKLRIALENADDEAVVLEEVTDAEDPNIEYAADNEKWVYELNYNLSHPFENDCRYPVLDKASRPAGSRLQYGKGSGLLPVAARMYVPRTYARKTVVPRIPCHASQGEDRWSRRPPSRSSSQPTQPAGDTPQKRR